MGMGDNPNDRFSALLRQLVPDVPGCSDAMANQELHKAAAEFMRIAKTWRETLTLGSLADGYEFDIEQSEGYRARADVRWLKIDGVEIPRMFFRIDAPASAGDPQTLTMLDPYDSVSSGTVTARVVWVPSFDAGDLPDWVFEQHGGGFVDIARGRLMMMPKKPWSDFRTGKEVLAIGQRAAMAAKCEAERNDPQEFSP